MRYTGEFPPIKYWREYPNWEYALDEEHIEGQDETTLRPASNQTFISEDVVFTAADAIFSSDKILPALIEVGNRLPDGINVFINEADAWRICYDYPKKKWIAYVEHWLPEAERDPHISMDDGSIFPITIISWLPQKKDKKQLNFRIHSDGSKEEL